MTLLLSLAVLNIRPPSKISSALRDSPRLFVYQWSVSPVRRKYRRMPRTIFSLPAVIKGGRDLKAEIGGYPGSLPKFS